MALACLRSGGLKSRPPKETRKSSLFSSGSTRLISTHMYRARFTLRLKNLQQISSKMYKNDAEISSNYEKLFSDQILKMLSANIKSNPTD